MSSTKLLPCPFCGYTALPKAPKFVIIGDMILVRCYKCGAQAGYQESAENAAAVWNHRKDPGSCRIEVSCNESHKQ